MCQVSLCVSSVHDSAFLLGPALLVGVNLYLKFLLELIVNVISILLIVHTVHLVHVHTVHVLDVLAL